VTLEVGSRLIEKQHLAASWWCLKRGRRSLERPFPKRDLRGKYRIKEATRYTQDGGPIASTLDLEQVDEKTSGWLAHKKYAKAARACQRVGAAGFCSMRR